MADIAVRDRVEAFYRAYTRNDIDTLAGFLADDVEWTISGPADLLSFCGSHRGKAAVIDLMRCKVPAVFHLFDFAQDQMLIEGDRVATLNRLWGRQHDGRVISYRLAHFLRFRDDKLVSMLSLIDSYDAVEQVLGHALAQDEAHPVEQGDLVAV